MSETDTDEGFLAELRKSENWRFFGNKEPICPHCGAIYNIERHEHYELYNDDDRHEATCGSCDREFFVRTHTSHSFSTDEQDDLPTPSPQ